MPVPLRIHIRRALILDLEVGFDRVDDLEPNSICVQVAAVRADVV
jgi:hypothetical protein